MLPSSSGSKCVGQGLGHVTETGGQTHGKSTEVQMYSEPLGSVRQKCETKQQE